MSFNDMRNILSFILQHFDKLNLKITENFYLEYVFKFFYETKLTDFKIIYLLIMPLLESQNFKIIKELNSHKLKILDNEIEISNNVLINSYDLKYLKHKKFNKIKNKVLLETKIESLIFLNKSFYAKEIIQLKILIKSFKKD